ncbi:MAG: hypothetical protein ABSC56_08485 [Solirubrobacteraceae bacterium]|jgi:hypothetical protein
MAGPNREDAQLLVQLAQWGTSLGVGDAMPAILDEDFAPELADAINDTPVRTMLTYLETIGTLVKNGLLDRELVRDWIWVDGVWARVGPAAKQARARFGEPRLYENFEALTEK